MREVRIHCDVCGHEYADADSMAGPPFGFEGYVSPTIHGWLFARIKHVCPTCRREMVSAMRAAVRKIVDERKPDTVPEPSCDPADGCGVPVGKIVMVRVVNENGPVADIMIDDEDDVGDWEVGFDAFTGCVTIKPAGMVTDDHAADDDDGQPDHALLAGLFDAMVTGWGCSDHMGDSAGHVLDAIRTRIHAIGGDEWRKRLAEWEDARHREMGQQPRDDDSD